MRLLNQIFYPSVHTMLLKYRSIYYLLTSISTVDVEGNTTSVKHWRISKMADTVFVFTESTLESLTNNTGTNKISKKSLKETISKAVIDLRKSFAELKSALENEIGTNEHLMETVRTVRICNQESKMLENPRSIDGQVVACIPSHIESSTGNEDYLTSDDTSADSIGNKFEFESDPNLHAALEERPGRIFKFRQQNTAYRTKTHMDD